jgi:hypothetical protein
MIVVPVGQTLTERSEMLRRFTCEHCTSPRCAIWSYCTYGRLPGAGLLICVDCLVDYRKVSSQLQVANRASGQRTEAKVA